jgi:hypothetical protein
MRIEARAECEDVRRRISARRVAAQELARHAFDAPEDLVAWLGAVQAQDYAGVKWALGLRLRGGTEDAIERALDAGAILRTHAFRFTWQLVTPADVRWMLALVAPRLHARAARRNKELELDPETLRKSKRVVERALRDGEHLTRHELAAALERAGISPAKQRLAHILAHAEIDGVICSGARRGKQSTYALLDLRTPSTRPIARDEALATLAARYFRSRGPATVADFVWWSGLAPSDARAGLDGAKRGLVSDIIDGRTYFLADGGAARRARSGSVWLLPPFDEYLIAYRDRTAVLDPRHAKRVNRGGGLLDPSVVEGGRVVGTWRRTIARGAVAIEISPFAPMSARAFAGAAKRYAAFLGLTPTVHCRA